MQLVIFKENLTATSMRKFIVLFLIWLLLLFYAVHCHAQIEIEKAVESGGMSATDLGVWGVVTASLLALITYFVKFMLNERKLEREVLQAERKAERESREKGDKERNEATLALAKNLESLTGATTSLTIAQADLGETLIKEMRETEKRIIEHVKENGKK